MSQIAVDSIPNLERIFPSSLQPFPPKKNNYISKYLVKKLSGSWAKPKPTVPATQLLSTPPSHQHDPQGRRGAQLQMINSYCIFLAKTTWNHQKKIWQKCFQNSQKKNRPEFLVGNPNLAPSHPWPSEAKVGRDHRSCPQPQWRFSPKNPLTHVWLTDRKNMGKLVSFPPVLCQSPSFLPG